jgi:hypothetical protein
MELRDAIFAPTLAQRLGETLHLSPLRRKLLQASGAGEHLPQWLLKVAVERGASHYRRDFDPAFPPDNPTLTNEEVAVGLCLGQMPDDPTLIRAAIQLLSSPKTDLARLMRLARQERVETVLRYAADACLKVDPALEPWATIRRELHSRREVPDGLLPHWSRFAALIGLTRQGMAPPAWIMRREQS